jgi:hypothetical protein
MNVTNHKLIIFLFVNHKHKSRYETAPISSKWISTEPGLVHLVTDLHR